MTVYRRPDPIPLHRGRPADMALHAVRAEPEDLHRLVSRQIFSAIWSGRYPEGSILPNEQALSEELGVSRTALREAVKGLASKGLIETRRRRGTQVLERSQWNMLDSDVIDWLRREDSRAVSQQLWETLAPLLPPLARLAATRAPLAIAAGAPLAQGQTDLAARTAFLIGIAAAAGNKFALSIITRGLTSLITADQPFLDAALHNLGPDTARQVTAHVAARNGEAAAQALSAALYLPLPLPAGTL